MKNSVQHKSYQIQHHVYKLLIMLISMMDMFIDIYHQLHHQVVIILHVL